MKQPNIILVNCDDLGYGDLGCYGSSLNRTPALDRMAEEGLRFTDFYMASSVCSPSRGAMMTGCYPPRFGFGRFDNGAVLFPGSPYGLHENEVTLPALLQQKGYRTKLVGKWHCGDQPEFLPTRRGFDEYYGLPYSNDMGRQVERESAPPLPLMRDTAIIQEQPDQAGLTERYTEEAVRFIRQNKERPFFLYLAHMYVHVPIYTPHRFKSQSRNGGYGAAVEHIDWTMAVILDELKHQNLDEDTLVIFTSDNGSRARNEGGSNAPLRGTKATTWEGGIRVPCIMRWPGRIAPGTETPTVTSAIDFLPTLVGFAGGCVPEDRVIDGVDLHDLLIQGTQDLAERPFFYYMKNDLEAVRQGAWKLHLHRARQPLKELYNLELDPGETVNCYDQQPDVVQRLLKLADQARIDLGDEVLDVVGKHCRPIGRVEHPQPLTIYDANHPYMVALYDLADTPVMSG